MRLHSIKYKAISFLALKLIPQCSEKITHSKIEKAFIDIGLTFKSLVRIEDTVSLYTSDTYLFMLANTQYSEAEIILERISALVNCIAFDSGNTQSPLTLTLLTSIANVQSNETSKDTIKRVLHSLSPAPTKTLLQDIA